MLEKEAAQNNQNQEIHNKKKSMKCLRSLEEIEMALHPKRLPAPDFLTIFDGAASLPYTSAQCDVCGIHPTIGIR